jgi:hypothetical protein
MNSNKQGNNQTTRTKNMVVAALTTATGVGGGLTRREALRLGLGVVGAGAAIGISGCVEEKVGNAAGDAMITIGGLVLLIPHPLGKIIGAALTVGGAGLKIYMATKDGKKKETEIELTEEQRRKIKQSQAAGDKIIVTQADGQKDEFYFAGPDLRDIRPTERRV